MGSHIAWGITKEAKICGAGLPQGWPYNNSNNWSEVEHTTRFRDITVNPQGERPIIIDENNRIWFWQGDIWKGQPQPLKGSPSVLDLAVGDHFLWGILENGSLAAPRSDLTTPWYEFTSNARFSKIDIGNNELWTLAENGKLYHTREGSGDYLEFVHDNIQDFTVGVSFVWLVMKDGSVKFSKLSDFANGKTKNALPFKMQGKL